MRAVLSLVVCLTVPVAGQCALPPCDPNVAANGWTNCRGTHTQANGDRYVGEHRDGKRHGLGILTRVNGDKYVGEWRDDTANGQGSYTWANGDKYVGEFRHDKFHGQGVLTYSDGTLATQKGVSEDGKTVRGQRIPDQ